MQYDIDINGPYKELFLYVRELLLSFEDMREKRTSYITSFYCEGSGICYIKTHDTGLTIAMFKGAYLKDEHTLFSGLGKTIRHMYMTNKKDIKKDILLEYFQNAIVYNIEKEEKKLMAKLYKKNKVSY